MKQFFITGTDTDCGKTYVTCQLIKYFKQEGIPILGIKPIASGSTILSNELINEDIEQLKNANFPMTEEINRWQFREPISPHLAAKASGIDVRIEDIIRFSQQKKITQTGIQLIEGAGGLMVPINDEDTWLDFLILSKIPVVLVVGIRLGCINHALLTHSVLSQHSISCIGWIANCIDPTMAYVPEIIETLSNKMNFPLLSIIKFDSNIKAESLKNYFI